MISINSLHPSFDISMELLCCLPILSMDDGAMVRDIVKDLGFRKGEFTRLTKKLKKVYNVVVFNKGGCRHAGIERVGWAHARRAAQLYWDEVYGVTLERFKGLSRAAS